MNHANPAFEKLLPLLRSPGDSQAWQVSIADSSPPPGGVLDLLGDRFRPTLVQRLLDTRVTAALYDYTRELSLRLATDVKSFADEVAMIAARLQVRPGQTVLDLACGHGNFTAAWAE